MMSWLFVLKYINTHDVVTLCKQSIYLETAHTYPVFSPLKEWFSILKYSVLKYINTHDVVTLCKQSVYLETAHTYQI